jgi:hypothetical protein
LVQQIDSTPTRGVGVQLAIRREGKASNSAIAIVITGFEARDELDIGPFVSTLGNRDHLGQQIPQSGPLVPNKIA